MLKKKTFQELGISLFLFLFSFVYFISSLQIPNRARMTPAPGTWPLIITGGMLLLSIYLTSLALWKLRTSREKEGQQEQINLKAVVCTLLLLIGYASFFRSLGYTISTLLYLFLQIRVLTVEEKRSRLLVGAVALTTTVFIHVVFRYGLMLILPQGILSDLLK